MVWHLADVSSNDEGTIDVTAEMFGGDFGGRSMDQATTPVTGPAAHDPASDGAAALAASQHERQGRFRHLAGSSRMACTQPHGPVAGAILKATKRMPPWGKILGRSDVCREDRLHLGAYTRVTRIKM